MQDGREMSHVTEAPERPMSKGEAIALRRLNLVFSLSVAPAPLRTEQIINDPEIGYTGPSRDSRIKTFTRDREALAELGFHIRETHGAGDAKNEQRSWEIDRAATHANPSALSAYDAEEVVAAIDQIFALHANDPTRWPLQVARAKLCELAGIERGPSATHGGAIRHNTTQHHLNNLWSAFSRRRSATFTYRDAQGLGREHIVDIYGLFESGSNVYLVGRDHAANGMRTFRTDRVVSAKPVPDSRKPYIIPAAFDVAEFQFLPFDFSSDEPVPAEFSFPAGVGAHEIELITKGRGALSVAPDGSTRWEIEVRDLDGAARFAIEHAFIGLAATGPRELIERISLRKQQAVRAHGAER